MNSLSDISHLLSIPVELQTLICTSLKEIDLSIMGITSKHFHNLLKNDLLWRNDKVFPCYKPTLSEKERLFQTYRSYCQFFASNYPELKKEASLNLFEQKLRTDEFLLALLQEDSFPFRKDSYALMEKILKEKPEIMGLVIDVLLNLETASLELFKTNILANSVKYAPDETPYIVEKLKIDLLRLPIYLHNALLNLAVEFNQSLIPFLLEKGMKPEALAIKKAIERDTSLIPIFGDLKK